MADEEAVTQQRASKIIYSDLTKEHNETALAKMNTCLDDFKTEKDVATELKKEFDGKYGGTWQAIVGACFGCSLTHKTNAVVHFQMEHTNTIMYVLLFQSDE
ncbi:hypothetical protein ScalyP_jg7042 [Parmales sp. scaly parma]|nr:hypothetical protein ScalyP_jg7042 [Parmales sp. scaly parma]